MPTPYLYCRGRRRPRRRSVLGLACSWHKVMVRPASIRLSAVAWRKLPGCRLETISCGLPAWIREVRMILSRSSAGRRPEPGCLWALDATHRRSSWLPSFRRARGTIDNEHLGVDLSQADRCGLKLARGPSIFGALAVGPLNLLVFATP